MEELLSLLATVPTWVWIIIFIVVVFTVFGESIVWEYEVKFPFREGFGRGEVEFECGKKKGTRAECTFELDPKWENVPLSVHIGDELMVTIPANKVSSGRFRYTEFLHFDEPTEGDVVVVQSGEKVLFSGPLVRD